MGIYRSVLFHITGLRSLTSKGPSFTICIEPNPRDESTHIEAKSKRTESVTDMATIAAGGVGLGGVKLHTLNPKPPNPFLGKKIKLRPTSVSNPHGKFTISKSKPLIVYASGGEFFNFAHDLFVGVGVGLPCTVMECGDIIYRSTLPRSNAISPTVPGLALALGAVSYLWATPGVAPGFWDMFVLAFVERLFRPTYRKDDFVLGKKLGEGAFGVVYRASLAKKPSSKVPKHSVKFEIDRYYNIFFLKAGDLVLKKATEYGAVEIWMNERARRACANSCADFVYGFLETSSKKGGEEYWLIWRFEGEATLSDLMLSKDFPYNNYLMFGTLLLIYAVWKSTWKDMRQLKITLEDCREMLGISKDASSTCRLTQMMKFVCIVRDGRGERERERGAGTTTPNLKNSLNIVLQLCFPLSLLFFFCRCFFLVFIVVSILSSIQSPFSVYFKGKFHFTSISFGNKPIAPCVLRLLLISLFQLSIIIIIAKLENKLNLHLNFQFQNYEIDILDILTFKRVCENKKIDNLFSYDRLICLVLTLPVSMATTKCTFSAMKIVEAMILGEDENLPKGLERENRIIQTIMRQLLFALDGLHSTGIVHRDIKPQNIIFSEAGSRTFKIIDLGAAADLRVGINYIPKEFLLDPRSSTSELINNFIKIKYTAPEQYIMSTQTPSAPSVPVATALSPVLWQSNKLFSRGYDYIILEQLNLPDRFDIYSSGLIFLQMFKESLQSTSTRVKSSHNQNNHAFPALRTDSSLIQFNRQLKRCDYDLVAWRKTVEPRANNELRRGFELLDLDEGIGWELLTSMVRYKARKRTSAKAALAHPYFDREGLLALSFMQKLRLQLFRTTQQDYGEAAKWVIGLMAKSGTKQDGGFTEAQLQELREIEPKKKAIWMSLTSGGRAYGGAGGFPEKNELGIICMHVPVEIRKSVNLAT
ncbi:hypothetical protein HYC85_029638 [Camellia sinensis]|uniref:Protein kinase domain-containing protein n=1 Tax=Camellia sinensis TaxID=4442 RepID=A0A7J7FZ62_CAMSI|nr:hypothetical protein HYC85_029638 [Camellia sinensis]